MPKTTGTGYCTFRDADGDTANFRASAKGILGRSTEATFTITNGTGKYKGITGTGWFKANNVPSFEQGTFQALGTFGGSYQIP